MSTITDGMFSGTNVRHYAYNFITIKPEEVVELCEAIKIGNMTPLDCLCYVNDIRNGGGKGIGKLPITVEDWNTRIASCKGGCDKYLIDVDVEVRGLLVENKGISEKVAIALQDDDEGEEPEVGVEKEEEPPMPSPEKFKYDRIAKIWDVRGQPWLFENKGGTRKKKKKRRRRKTKRNHKRRKNKHSRKRKRKRRRKRKTRRN